MRFLGVFLFLCAAATAMATISYDQNYAKLALYFSASAYCDTDTVSSWSCISCGYTPSFELREVSYDPSLNTFGYIGYDAGRNLIVVAFRGTEPESFVNWVVNFDFSQKQSYDGVPGTSVHTGFYDAYMGLKEPIHEALVTLREEHPSAMVLFTGHSLGAAIAELAVVDMMVARGLNLGHRAQLVTFGCPRVGDHAFATYAEASLNLSWRVTHSSDIVPHVPPEDFGFWHAATEVWYPDNNLSHEICEGGEAPAGSEDPHCSDSRWWRTSIDDHLHYLDIMISRCPAP